MIGVFPLLMQREPAFPAYARRRSANVPLERRELALHGSQAVVICTKIHSGRAHRWARGRIVGQLFQSAFSKDRSREGEGGPQQAQGRLRRGPSNPSAEKRTAACATKLTPGQSARPR
jgi:hypothetical protein